MAVYSRADDIGQAAKGIQYSEVIEMKEGVTVTNIMADGSICEDLTTYQFKEPIPEDVLRLFADFMRQGRKIRQQREKEQKERCEAS